MQKTQKKPDTKTSLKASNTKTVAKTHGGKPRRELRVA